MKNNVMRISVVLLVVLALCVGLVSTAWGEVRFPVFEDFIDSPELVVVDRNETWKDCLPSQEEIIKGIPILMEWVGEEMGDKYPGMTCVRIDGVPWQESPYANIIWEHLDRWKTGYYATHPELKKVFQNPRLNEHAWEVRKLLDQGKTAEEIEQIILGDQSEDSTIVTPSAPAPGEYSIVLYLNRKDYSVAQDGQWQEAAMDAAPVIENERTLIPLRGVLEQFGATVDWDEETGQVTVTYGDKKVVLILGSNRATVNEDEVSLDAPATSRNGRTLIPLRFVSEQLGLDVEWNQQTQSITVKGA